jgi:phage FluMu gp28-like protein
MSSDPAILTRTWALPTQAAYLNDPWHLRIWEKSRQVGATKTDALDSVLKASPAEARFDVWVSSRDELQARLYLEDCLDWAKILHVAATDLGMVLLDPKNRFTAHVLEFANGRRIYCLSSNPNALAGKRGHVKLDEFALHEDQRQLFRIAKPVMTWGGTLSLISTHRGTDTMFNQFITDIRHNGNPMGWHLFSYPIQKAVEEGIVERINEKSGCNETPEEYLARSRAECGPDIETWHQEYCCLPSDENSAFFDYDILTGCTDPSLKLVSLNEFLKYAKTPLSDEKPNRTFFGGVDVGRTTDLFVLDVGEKIGSVIYDRLRIEIENRPFTEMEEVLFPILGLPQLKRCCMDAGSIGTHLHERTRARVGYKADGIKFTGPLKEEMAFRLRADFEERNLRIPSDPKLLADLRALKKEPTKSGQIRLDGQFENSHCDRTWAKALRQHAVRLQSRPVLTARLG